MGMSNGLMFLPLIELFLSRPWDMTHFLARQCKVNGISYPSYAKRWINIRKVFSNHYKMPQATLQQMLTHLGMEFEGRQHSGFDDTHNISRVVIRMLIDGANPIINERISWRAVDRTTWNGMRAGYVRTLINKKYTGEADSDSDDTEGDELQEKIRSAGPSPFIMAPIPIPSQIILPAPIPLQYHTWETQLRQL